MLAAAAAEPPKPDSDATLTGRVLDADGRPVAGADVRLQQYQVAGDRARGTTGESGSYRFEGVPEGHYVLVASARDMARSFRVTPVEDGELSLDVVLSKPVTPVIELRDEQGRPVAGARVRELRQRGDNGEFFLRRVDWDTFGVTISPSDAQGRLRLPPLPAGTIFTATIDHHQQAPVRIRDVPAAEDTIATATMQRGVPLALRIQPDESGATVADLLLELHRAPFDHPSTIRVDRIAVGRDGTAAIAVEAGEYDLLRLRHEDFFVTPIFIPRGHERLRIDAGQNNELSFHLRRKVQVRGRVVDVSTGQPLVGMSVLGWLPNHLDPASAAAFPNEWAPAGWGETDANGEYTISLAARRARLSFDGDTYIADQHEIGLDVAADGSTVVPDFKVRPLSKIVGTVLDPAGEPVPRAVVRFRGRYLAWPPLLTDERGRFEFEPPWIPTAGVTDERLPPAPIVAFHPYEPMSAAVMVRLNDAEAVANVTLTLEKREYESVLSDFASEMPGWQQGDTSTVSNAADRLARSLHGRPAPELDGAAWLNTERPQMSLADFRGRYVLLDFWFISCGPCHADFPSVKLVHELYKSRGVTVIGVHDNSATPEAVRAHVQRQGLEFPIVVDHPDGRIVARYQTYAAVPGFPSYVLIGPDGNVVHVDYTVPAPSLWTYKLEIIRRYAMGTEAGSEERP